MDDTRLTVHLNIGGPPEAPSQAIFRLDEVARKNESHPARAAFTETEDRTSSRLNRPDYQLLLCFHLLEENILLGVGLAGDGIKRINRFGD